jgi:hypothetical protein
MSRTRVVNESRAYDTVYDPVFTTVSVGAGGMYRDRRVAPAPDSEDISVYITIYEISVYCIMVRDVG